MARLCILFTTVMAVLVAWALGQTIVESSEPRSAVRFPGEQALFVAGVAVLLYGNLIYQVARLGSLRQHSETLPLESHELWRLYDQAPPSLVFLVPSYREDPRLMRMTLLSAALQAYPRRRVVLLIDDPPNPLQPNEVEALHAARRLPQEVADLLEKPRRRFNTAFDDFQRRHAHGLDPVKEGCLVAALFDCAAAWFEQQARLTPVSDHTERFFVREVLEAPAANLRALACDLRRRGARRQLSEIELVRSHRQLRALFDVELTSFERKQYVNLSHEPNKAMNLNSYIGLFGKRYRSVEATAGKVLEVSEATDAVAVPAPDYVISLDADSFLLPGYAQRLIAFLERPGNEQIAVAQTPYSAVPGTTEPLERAAGATTDVMYLVHQGMSHYGAGYWVGANAVLRLAALEDIAQTIEESGYPITRYVPDRTVIEDTEATIAFLCHGWRLANYPARLAYSATPQCYGSLLIQRRRWANGGLLLIAQLCRYAASRRGKVRGLPEVLMRLHYLVSVAGANTAFLVLTVYPFQDIPARLWLPASLTALPYFGLYARDLAQLGYRYAELLRVYALTLLLIPVNLGGVLMSLRQACTGRKSPFSRTPKVASRIAAPPLYVLVTLCLLVYWMFGAASDLEHDRSGRAAFLALNACMLAYAITRFVGWSAAARDLTGGFKCRTRALLSDDHPLPQERHHGRLRPLGVVLRGVAVLTILVLALPFVLYLRLGRADISGLTSTTSARMNVLVVGVDSRAGLSDDERRELVTGSFEGANADTIFLLSMQGRSSATLSLPRDLYVSRCDGSWGRINAAISIDGPRCLIDTVEAFTGVPVTRYVEVDLAGFVRIVDALGGVTMSLAEPVVDERAGADLPAGRQRMSGSQALAYVRAREADDDLRRIGRQQAFVRALAEEITSLSTLRNPVRLWNFSWAAPAAMAVDRDMRAFDLIPLIRGLRAVASDGTAAFIVPVESRRIAGDRLLVPVPAEATAVLESFAAGSALHDPPETVLDMEMQ